jgi:hypothetical protein
MIADQSGLVALMAKMFLRKAYLRLRKKFKQEKGTVEPEVTQLHYSISSLPYGDASFIKVWSCPRAACHEDR